MTTVRIQNRQKTQEIPTEAIQTIVKGVLEKLDLLGVEISIVFCDDPWIAELNQTYLGRKGPTNVISFPMDEQDEGDAPLRMLGDVVINVDRAVSDAAEADLEPFYEITYLLIHGICHLAGFDHEGDQAHRALEMEAMERKLHSQFYPIFKEGIGGKKQTP